MNVKEGFLNTTDFVAFICESTLWGAYISSILTYTLVLLNGRRSIHVSNAVPNALLLLISTTHFALRAHQFSLRLSSGSTVVDSTATILLYRLLLAVSNVTCNMAFVQRCWAVRGRNIRAVHIPVSIAILGFAFSLASAIVNAKTHPTTTAGGSASAIIDAFSTSGYGLILISNVISTLQIIHTVWPVVRRKFGAPSESHLWEPWPSNKASEVLRATSIIVESGILFMGMQLALTIVSSLRLPMQLIIYGVAIQVYAITPLLMALQVAVVHATAPSVPPQTVESLHEPPPLRFSTRLSSNATL